MSSTRQAVILGPSLMDLGYRPDFTPAYHVLLETGMMAGVGGLVLESPMIFHIRKKPVAGNKVFADVASIEMFSIQI
jgi:hypothetical protein